MTAMQALHDVWHNFVIFIRRFPEDDPGRVAFLAHSVVFCKCKMNRQFGSGCGKAIGGCSLFVLALVAGRKTGARCGS
jgi:hypothetical protein